MSLATFLISVFILLVAFKLGALHLVGRLWSKARGFRSDSFLLRLTPTIGLQLQLSSHHYHPRHGPKTWPWWRLLVVDAVRANPDNPFSTHPVHHWNLWFYTRWGAHCHYFAIDRRTPAQRGLA
jgi:hypothetical protein